MLDERGGSRLREVRSLVIPGRLLASQPVDALRRAAPWRGALLVLFLLGSARWLLLLMQSPLHEDEAIYGAWAFQILRGDPWLVQVPVDKPPLTLYPIGAAVALFGQQEWAARLPGLLWGLLLLGLTGRIAARRGHVGHLAVALVLTSPLFWALAASAFTDLAMVALSLLAIERALARRFTAAGVAFALAQLAKPTALFLMPLVLVALFDPAGDEGRRERISSFLLAMAAPLLLAWAWDASRSASSWWALGRQAYGTLGQMALDRRGWGEIALHSLGPMVIGVGLLHLLGGGQRGRARWATGLLLTLLLWIPVHVLLGFQPWERYLLPLVPVGALAGVESAPRAAERTRHATELLLFLGLLAPALVAPFQLEPHDGRWQGIAVIGEAIEALPGGATIWYSDTGRPLAWYAADARATLRWAGNGWEQMPPTLLPASYYVARRGERLPEALGEGRPVVEAGGFQLFVLDDPVDAP